MSKVNQPARASFSEKVSTSPRRRRCRRYRRTEPEIAVFVDRLRVSSCHRRLCWGFPAFDVVLRRVVIRHDVKYSREWYCVFLALPLVHVSTVVAPRR